MEKAEEAALNIGQSKHFYEKCLAQLRQNPTDPHGRQQALEAGRTYAAYRRHREGGRLTLYDETSIANEIEAASAAALANLKQRAEASLSFEERLERLEGLRAKNLLTDEEYKDKRAAILAEL